MVHQLPPILKELKEEQNHEKVYPNHIPPYPAAQAHLVSRLAQLMADLRLLEQVDSWQLELAAVGKSLARSGAGYIEIEVACRIRHTDS